MPTTAIAKYPKPDAWEEFESICIDLLQKLWNDPYIKRHGRQGQKQHGVDISGSPEHLSGFVGAQCKNTEEIGIKDIKDEVEETESFEPPLKKFLIMVACERDSELEKKVRILSQQREERGNFPIRIMFWKDICLKLSRYPNLMLKHFPQFFEDTESKKGVIRKIMDSDLGDWNYKDEMGVCVFEPDLNLKIVREPFEKSRKFEEEWVENFPNPESETNHHIIYYNNTPIRKIGVVSVDGGRCNIPYPEKELNEEKEIVGLYLNEFKYKIGKIINKYHYELETGPVQGRYHFEKNLERAGIDYPSGIK